MKTTCVWVSVFKKLCHPPTFPWILAASPVFRNGTGLSVRGPHFFGWMLVGLVNNSSECQNSAGLSVLDVQHAYLTLLRDGDPSGTGLAVLVYPLSPDTVENVMGGELDELEEDLGWSISCLEDVTDIEEGKLEEELVKKPETTKGTEVLRVALYPNPV